MEVKYIDKKLIAKENRQAIGEVEQMLSFCTSFDIYCAEEYGVWGIWMDLVGVKYLINPIYLIDSIYLDRGCWFMKEYPKSGNQTKIIDFYKDYCFYTLRFPYGTYKNLSPIFISFEEYISKIKECIEKLYSSLLNQKPIAYEDPKLDINILNIMVAQMRIKAVLPSYYRIMASEVKEEFFLFDIEEDKYNECYTIGVGNRKYTTYLTHWDNDYDTIRFQIESFVVNREAMVNLNFDGSATIVKIKEVNILDNIYEVGEGYGFNYKEYALVEIQPNEFVNGSIIKGFCNLKHSIRVFYEGLLSLAMNHPIESDEHDEDYCMIEAYNKIKSPIIERYISDIKVSYEKAELRQIYVKRVLTICPAYDYIIIELDGTVIDVDLIDGSLEELYDDKGETITIQGLKEWQCEIRHVVIDGEMGKDTSTFDWGNYHERGLLFAQQLREKLSSDFDLWYEAPIADNSGTIPQKRLIYKKSDE